MSRNGSTLSSIYDRTQIWQASFGEAATLREVLKANPREALAHVRHNAAGFSVAVSRLLQPNSRYQISFYAALGLLALCWAGAVFARRKRQPRALGCHLKQRFGLLAATGVLVAPPVAAMLAIYPNAHYLLLAVVPALLGVAGLAFSPLAFPSEAIGQARREPRFFSLGVIAAAALLAAVFAVQSLAVPARPKPHLLAVRHLQSLGFESLPREMTVFNRFDYGLYMEAGSQFVQVRYFREWPGFAEAHRHYNVHAVVLSPFLATRDARLANDPEWHAFLADPAAWGYIALPIPGLPAWTLLVSESVHEQLNP